MTELITAAQMRAIEAAAIASGAVTGLELMERAGRGVVEAIFEEWPELATTSHRAVVLCGPGNNGGDGFVVARLLKEWGWEVAVFLYGDPDKLPPDARVNYERWSAMGPVAELSSDASNPLCRTESGTKRRWRANGEALVIDALFGSGLSRGLDQFNAQLAAALAQHRIAVGGISIVSIDVPSGLCADSGRRLSGSAHWPAAISANLTVTFHKAKLGHVLEDGPRSCGKVSLKEIGLEHRDSIQSRRNTRHETQRQALAHVHGAIDAYDVPRLAGPHLVKSGLTHKYNHGHAVVLSGPIGRSGAARLAARAALRVGAGLVTVAAPGSAMMECAVHVTAIMLRKCDGAEGLAALMEDKRLNALCVGPGLGVGQTTRDLVAVALADQNRGAVLDADALTSFADDPKALFALLHPKVVLTPHMGEFARLFPDISEALSAPATTGPAYSKVDAVRAAAARAGCVVLLKGADTVIGDATGRCVISAAVYDRAAPWLATAGSGDVLAGLIAGFLARGLFPIAAAETAAYLHVEAARAFGPGLIAEDLPEMIPQVFRDMGL